MSYVLKTSALCKNYGSFAALKDVSLHVPKGAIYGFVGKNGAGKTTLIRLICGLQNPSSGDFTLYGRNNHDKSFASVRRRIGAVIETPSIYLDMSAEENLKQQYLMLGLPSFEGLQDILQLVGLSNTGKRKVRNFSLGMRQRLGIAIALVGDPDFLILDEPVNGLDPQGIIEIRELILKLNREQQITFLISSHMLDELAKLATHYGFIDHGCIVQEISAEELQEACRTCVHIVVNDTKLLACYLDERQVEYKILSHTEADIYASLHVSELALALHSIGCEIKSMSERDENLESYYMDLLGGGTYA